MISSCNTIVDRRDHVQYLTVSKSHTCSLIEQNTTLMNLYYGCRGEEQTSKFMTGGLKVNLPNNSFIFRSIMR